MESMQSSQKPTGVNNEVVTTTEEKVTEGNSRGAGIDDSSDNDYNKDDEPASIEKGNDTPGFTGTDGGYGWVTVGCQFVVTFMTWGINSSYGVYLQYYLESDYFPGATPLQFAFVGGLSMSCAFVGAPFHTWAMNRFGFRWVYFGSTVCLLAALLGASFATQIWHLFLSQGVLFGIGMGGTFVVSINIPPPWFYKRRALALALAAGGSGLGGFVWGQAVSKMIDQISLHWALRMQAIVSTVFCAICGVLYKEKKGIERQSFKPFDLKLLRENRGFWGVIVWTVFFLLGYISLIYSLSSYVRQVGIDESGASWATSILNIGMFVGRPVVGYFSDYGGRINLSCIMMIYVGLLCLLFWNFVYNFSTMVGFALIVGFGAGTFWATIASVTAEVVGLHHLNAALSMVWITAIVPSTFSEAIAVNIMNVSRHGLASYVGGCYLCGAMGLLWAKFWKQRQDGVQPAYKIFVRT